MRLGGVREIERHPVDAPRDDLIRANLDPARVAVEGRTMVGYPIVFDTWTEIHSWEGDFKERIAPSALTKTLRESRNKIKVLFNHGMDPQIGDKPLGRPDVMRADAEGLYTEVPLSETSYNDDLLALMRDGAVDGQSFRFSVVKEEWDRPKKGLPERTITELRLFEFGPVTFPAYQATTVGIRSRRDFAEWRGIDDTKRAEIARVLGISVDQSTLTEAADGTSLVSRPPTTNEPHPHSEVSTRQAALRAIAILRGVITP